MEHIESYELKNDNNQSSDLSVSPKKQAFLDMQEMRKSSPISDISLDQMRIALDEKYGAI